jgi:hypothetical protein
MTVNSVSLQAMSIQKHQDLVKSESRHLEMVVDQRHIKERLIANEEKRIEANRRMLRAGQNVDKLA